MKTKRQIRHKRVRAKVFGTRQKPRLSVYRSNKHLFLQLIDDESGKTILSVSDKEIKSKKKNARLDSQARQVKKSDRAYEAGKLLADKAKAKKIQKVVFDRGGYKYHGRVRRVAEGAREGGLNF